MFRHAICCIRAFGHPAVSETSIVFFKLRSKFGLLVPNVAPCPNPRMSTFAPKDPFLAVEKSQRSLRQNAFLMPF